MGVKEAAELLGLDVKTINRMVDDGRLRGGRLRNPDGTPTRGPGGGLSHRWVDAAHAREIAAASQADTGAPS